MKWTWLLPWHWGELRRLRQRIIDAGESERRAAAAALADAQRRQPAVNRMVAQLNTIYEVNGLGEKFRQAMRE